ncbi:MAG TPA: RsbRD N-terminal domain-containing protein [Blastocatellia bacterium]|nr:RsbRD N-terminal domain-containing protein [Blastocatellia bacterium]
MAYSDFADWLAAHNEAITAMWAEAVRQEPRIQSDAELSDDGLRDHIPAVIAEICELLRVERPPSIINTREARVHAYVRFRQGYRARELVRELSLLRVTLLDQLGDLLLSAAFSVSIQNYLAVARFIDLYIDEELSYAVSVYAEVMKEKITADASSVQEKN